MNPRDQGPALLLAPGRNRSGQLGLAASPHPRQNRARLRASEDGVEELVLSLPLDETCGDHGVTAEANSRRRSGWVACGHGTDLPDVLRRRSQWLVSLCSPQGVAMPPIVQADGNAESGFVRRQSSMLRNTEIAWGNGKTIAPREERCCR